MPDRTKIALAAGTRPEAIKLAPLYLALRDDTQFEPRLWVTGQHREMLDHVLETFGLAPDRDFAIMKPGQSLNDVFCAVLRATEAACAEEEPGMVVVQGDTTSAFAAALAAFHARIPVAHVEAGLRTFNKFSPYPEELNREVCTRIADLHFAPTQAAWENLSNEGVPLDDIWVTGNTVIDALDIVVKRVRARKPDLPEDFPATRIKDGRRMVLITGHRRENFGRGFENICAAILALSAAHPDTEFVYPVHLNPAVREPVLRLLGGRENIHLIAPLRYEAFVWVMDRSYFLLSDSGGVQEEAPHLGKPVLVMRDTTERPEAVTAGTAKLVGTNSDTIVAEANRLLENEAAYHLMSEARNPYGDGRACEHILAALHKTLPKLLERRG